MNKTYIFDTEHYLAWCQAYSLDKNNQRVLELFKSRCEFELAFDKIKKAQRDLPDYDSI